MFIVDYLKFLINKLKLFIYLPYIFKHSGSTELNNKIYFKNKNPMFNKSMLDKSKLKLSKINTAVGSMDDIQVFDKNDHLLYTFSSANKANKDLNISKSCSKEQRLL